MTTTPRRSRKLFVLIPAALLGLLGASAAFAGGGYWNAHRGHSGWHNTPLTEDAVRDRMDRVADKVMGELDGTDAQRDQVDTILDEAAPTVVALRSEGQALKQAFRSVMAEEPVDAGALEDLRLDAVSLFDRGSQEALGTMLALHDVLTPDQRDQVRSFADKHHQRRGGE